MISVIIPSRNRADFLASALDSLLRQTLSFDQFEVLVIDNGSTDNTAAIVQQYSTRLGNVRYFYECEPGLHVGRHRGMFAAKGNILVFADDDIEALPSWLISIKEAFSDEDVAMVGGNNYPLFLTTPPKWLLKMWGRRAWRGYKSIPSLSIVQFLKNPKTISPYQVWGCNFAIRKDVLLTAGGFHPDGMPKELIRFRGDGETHVSRYVEKSGMKCVFHPGASVHHKVPPERMTFKYFHQRGFNQGVSDSYTTLRNLDSKAYEIRRNLIRRILGWGWRQVKGLFPMDRDAKHAQNEMKQGYNEGYVYHQQMYRDDIEVRVWVHKSKYFEKAKT